MIDLLPRRGFCDVLTGYWVSNALSKEPLSSNNFFTGFRHMRIIRSYLYKFSKDAASVSEETSITYTVLIIKREQTTKCN